MSPLMSERATLDQATARAVRAALDQLQFGSLYEFLGLSRAASATELYTAADEQYRELRSMGRSDADSNIRQELAGQAMAMFAGVEPKERYDNALDREAMREFDGHLEVIGRDRYLEEDEIAALIRNAQESGVSEGVAREYVWDYAARRGWGLEIESSALQPGPEVPQVCPNCGKRMQGADKFCVSCGCPEEVRELLEQGFGLLEYKDVDRAEVSFTKAEVLWGDCAEVARKGAKACAALRNSDREDMDRVQRALESLPEHEERWVGWWIVDAVLAASLIAALNFWLRS